jgi:hypothetical protein
VLPYAVGESRAAVRESTPLKILYRFLDDADTINRKPFLLVRGKNKPVPDLSIVLERKTLFRNFETLRFRREAKRQNSFYTALTHLDASGN